MHYVLAYDIGTTGVKTCIFAIGKRIVLIAGASRSYPLYTLSNGGAEQEPDDWWKGMKATTKEVLEVSKLDPSEIEGISFCSQAQGLVLVDKDGHHLRRAMSYMDQRASEEVKKGMSYGLQVAGANIFKLIPSLVITGAVTSSVKDPVWKYKWVEAHEPKVFAKVHKWLDVKDYLILRCTDQFTMTIDSAYSTFLFDNRPKKMRWSKKLCKMLGVNMDHLPKIIKSTDCAGLLTKTAAKELGLIPGIKVFGGGSDASLIGVGAGATAVGDTHIYCGTSGWVNTVIDHRLVDTKAMIAGISGADDQTLNYFAEMETAGKCLDWAKNHLARDEIILYLRAHREYKTFEEKQSALFRYLNEKVKNVPPGAGGVLFTPWLHGNRCPFEDPKASGMFFGVTLETGKTELIRALLEGVYYHIRWMLECHEKKLKIKDTIRFVGGGAISPISCQLLANITGKKIETVYKPQNVGAVGAAAIVGVGLKLIPSLKAVKQYIPASRTFTPDMKKHEEFNPYYLVFKNLHDSNKKNFQELQDKSAKDKEKAHAERMRALKFFLFSISAGVIQLLCTTVFSLFLPIPSAVYLIGLVASVIWNFTFNRKFTFKSANNIPKAMALAFLFYVFFAPASTFLTAYLTNGDVLSLMTVAHVGILGSGEVLTENIPLAATLVTTLICMVFNFVLEFLWQRFVVFKDSIDTNKK